MQQSVRESYPLTNAHAHTQIHANTSATLMQTLRQSPFFATPTSNVTSNTEKNENHQHRDTDAAPSKVRCALCTACEWRVSRQGSHLSSPCVFRFVLGCWLSIFLIPKHQKTKQPCQTSAESFNRVHSCTGVRVRARARSGTEDKWLTHT